MSILKILGSELNAALSYISPAIGSRTSAQQESTLAHVEVLEDSKIKFRVQSNSIVMQAIVDSISTDDDLPVMLIEIENLERYVKNHSSDAVFKFDLSEVEDKELLSLTIGDTFMGKIATVPLDAYELENLEDKVELVDVKSSILNSMIAMSCQYANMKQDIQDYMQILISNDQLCFFTTDGNITAKFISQHITSEELDLTVRASGLRKIKRFSSGSVAMSMSEDNYYMILEEDENHIIAIVLHSDPPYSYQELEEIVEEQEYDHILSLDTETLSTAITNIGNSSKAGQLVFQIIDENTIKLSGDDLKGNSTKIDVNANIDGYIDELSSEKYTCSVALFRKITATAKKKGKLDLHFSLSTVGIDKYLTLLYCIGSVDSIDYKISFSVNSV
jgi:hypothetical protein